MIKFKAFDGDLYTEINTNAYATIKNAFEGFTSTLEDECIDNKKCVFYVTINGKIHIGTYKRDTKHGYRVEWTIDKHAFNSHYEVEDYFCTILDIEF